MNRGSNQIEFVLHFYVRSVHILQNQGWGWMEGFPKCLCLIAEKEEEVLMGSTIFYLKSFPSIYHNLNY